MRRISTAIAAAAVLAAAGCGGAEAVPAPVDCGQARCVALTFDDGPDVETGRLLDLLKQRGVPATFFVLGRQVEQHEALARRITAEGHEIGNHTWNHERLTTLSPAGIRENLQRTADLVTRVTGTSPTLVRPPFGASNSSVAAAAGAPIVLWTVDPRDWRKRDPDAVYERVTAQVRPGAIVILHDTRKTSVDAVPRILDTLAQRGYTFVTVSRLFGGHLEPGHTYRERPDPAAAP
jgi:peptidoglycan/xylan/chitin deacetylase (PgdA/CDA1 family)